MNHDEPAARRADAHAAPFDADDSIAPPLSAAGQARREAMLGDLLGSMRRVHSRRRSRRFGAAAIALVALAAGGAALLRPAPAGGPLTPAPRLADTSPPGRGVPVPAPRGAQTRIEYAVVRTDGSSVERFRARGNGLIERIGDDALLATLSDFGRAAGLIRTAAGVRLTDPIIDPPS